MAIGAMHALTLTIQTRGDLHGRYSYLVSMRPVLSEPDSHKGRDTAIPLNILKEHSGRGKGGEINRPSSFT